MFSKRLRELRKRNKLNQKDLSNVFNVSRASIGKWETNKAQPCYEMLIQISAYFNVSADYLLGISDNPARSNPDAGKGPYNIGLAGDTQSLTKEEINAIKAVLDAFRSTKK